MARTSRRSVPFYAVTRYPDGCYAVTFLGRRGPCAHSKPLAIARFQRSGFIAPAASGR